MKEKAEPGSDRDLSFDYDHVLPITEARRSLGHYVDLVRYKGKRVVLESHSKPAAVIVPISDLERGGK